MATGAKLPDTYAAGYFTACSSSTHIMRANTAAGTGQIVLGNFYLKAGVGEQPIPGTTTWKAALLYNGVLTPVTFGKQPTVSATNAAVNLVSDPLTLPPSGARFQVLILEQNPVGIVDNYSSGTYAPADLFTASTSAGNPVADCTTTGVVPNSISTGGNMPVAIIAPTTVASGTLLGDSRVSSLRAARDANGDGGELQPFIDAGYPSIVMAVAGDKASGTLANFALRKQLFAYTTFLIDELCINDVAGGGITPAACMGFRGQIAAMFPTAQVYGATLVPFTSSTDNWATPGNQTVSGGESGRVAFNTLDRAGASFETGVIDVDQMLDPNATGLWPTNGTANWCTSDGLHELAPCTLIEKRSSVWNGLRFTR